jgi:hypothetical protein
LGGFPLCNPGLGLETFDMTRRVDNDALDRIAEIHARLSEVGDWAKDAGDFETASTLVLVGGDLNNLFVEATFDKAVDDDIFQRLSAIDDRLIQLCYLLNNKQAVTTSSRLIPITDDLTRLLADLK